MSEQTEFERGEIAGKIEARLANHDRHFEKINGSIERAALALEANSSGLNRIEDKLDAAVDRLEARANADKDTVETTARALEKATDVQRQQDATSREPWQRYAVIGAALATVVGVVYTIVQAVG